MKKGFIALIAIGIGVSGCGIVSAPPPWQDGHVMLAGDAEGIRSFFDGANGLVSNARTQDPMCNSAHWQLRGHQETERTKRGCTNCGGFLRKLFGTSQPKEVEGS
jgi:hypothetical protein